MYVPTNLYISRAPNKILDDFASCECKFNKKTAKQREALRRIIIQRKMDKRSEALKTYATAVQRKHSQ